MITQAMYYEDGRVVLKNPLRLKTYPVKIELIIPDEYTEHPAERPLGECQTPVVEIKSTQLLEMLKDIQAVLGPLYGLTDDGKKDMEKFASELESYYR